MNILSTNVNNLSILGRQFFELSNRLYLNLELVLIWIQGSLSLIQDDSRFTWKTYIIEYMKNIYNFGQNRGIQISIGDIVGQ